ncbi:MAG TPA: protease HtpX [Syntrophomonas sp.]|jgi:heat shock protein HtpX|nr:protease HtpX [Syntrophomonas sp.]HCF71224.1 protease HtpX [Syntrophomonas sp.]
MNTLKTGLLMAGLSVLLVMAGSAIGGQQGAVIFFVISLGMNFFSYYYSDKMVIRMTGAQPVSEHEAPELYSIIRKLSANAGIPVPKLYVTPTEQPNAFATGRSPQHAAVAVTRGLLRVLDHNEVEGVIAHELAHIKNRDILIGTIAASMAGAISMIANIAQWGMIFGGFRGDDDEGGSSLLGSLLVMLVAPIAAMLIQMAVSRSREYMADATGARLAGQTAGLSNALLKLERASLQLPMEVNPAVSHMFIVQPLTASSISRLFSTHPATADRVEKLRALKVN